LLQAPTTFRTGAAGIDEAPNSDPIADLELADLAAHGLRDARNLVAGNHREDGVSPLIARLVNIGMADAAKLDIDENVVFPRVAPFKGKRSQLSLRR
jgi:hypothetical protein